MEANVGAVRWFSNCKAAAQEQRMSLKERLKVRVQNREFSVFSATCPDGIPGRCSFFAQETTPSVQPSARCFRDYLPHEARLGCNICVSLGTATGLECRRTNMDKASWVGLPWFTMMVAEKSWNIFVPQALTSKVNVPPDIRVFRIFSGGVSCLVLPSELWALKLAAGFLKEEAPGCLLWGWAGWSDLSGIASTFREMLGIMQNTWYTWYTCFIWYFEYLRVIWH